MRSIFILFLMGTLFLSCQETKTMHISEFDTDHIPDQALLVDIRTPEEYDAGHLDHALNINWYDEDFSEQISKVAKGKTLYIYCQKGGRSADAATLLDSLGYDVIDLTGGYGDLPK